MKVSVQIANMDEVRKKIGNLDTNKQVTIIRRALRKSAAPIRKEARAQAPVADRDYRRKTKTGTEIITKGTLKKSIAVYTGKSKEWLNVQVGSRKGNRPKYAAYYAHFVHDGHKKKGGGRTKANPFLERAGKAKEKEAAGIFFRELDGIIKKVMNR